MAGHGRRWGALTVAVLVVVHLMWLPGGRAGAIPLDRGAESSSEVRPGEVLVVTRAPGRASQVAMRHAVALEPNGDGQVVRLRVPPGQERARAAALRRDPDVAAAAPNYIRRTQIVPSDAHYARQWYMDRIAAPAAWDVTRGAPEIKIAILDSGADLRHPDLVPKLLPGANLLLADPGAVAPECPPSTTAQDDSGHGTHVTGIAGAATNNAVGVAGVAWDPRLIPVKVLDCNGNGSDSQIIAGIRWATDNGAHVINLSVGGPGQSQVLDDAIDYAWRRNVLVVAAAGNSATNVPYYPAASPHVISVGATDAVDDLAYFSNYGAEIDVVAPGTGILSTQILEREFDIEPGYKIRSGTSMASPMVAGAAALLYSRYPGYRVDRIAGILLSGADKITRCPGTPDGCAYGPSGRNSWFGHGRLNISRAMRFSASIWLPGTPDAAQLN